MGSTHRWKGGLSDCLRGRVLSLRRLNAIDRFQRLRQGEQVLLRLALVHHVDGFPQRRIHRELATLGGGITMSVARNVILELLSDGSAPRLPENGIDLHPAGVQSTPQLLAPRRLHLKVFRNLTRKLEGVVVK